MWAYTAWSPRGVCPRYLHHHTAFALEKQEEMGLLILGAPLSWEESKKYIDHVKQHGVEQIMNAMKGKRVPFYDRGMK